MMTNICIYNTKLVATMSKNDAYTYTLIAVSPAAQSQNRLTPYYPPPYRI